MRATTNRWKLGLFVVSGVLVAFGTLLWLGAGRFRRETERSVTYFDESVQGLNVGSPVKFRGVPVGNVTAITVAPDRRHVEVQSDLYVDSLERLGFRMKDKDPDEIRAALVAQGLRVQLASSGITGVKFIQADFYDPKRHPVPQLEFKPPPSFVPAVPSTLKSVEEAVVNVLERVPEMATRLDAILARVEKILSGTDADSVMARTNRLLDTLNDRLGKVDTARLGAQVEATLAEAERTLAQVRSLTASIQDPDGRFAAALARVERTAATVEEEVRAARVGDSTAAVRATSDSVAELARRAAPLADELIRDLGAFREAMERIRELADLLERDPSALLHGKSPDLISPSPERK